MQKKKTHKILWQVVLVSDPRESCACSCEPGTVSPTFGCLGTRDDRGYAAKMSDDILNMSLDDIIKQKSSSKPAKEKSGDKSRQVRLLN